MIGLLLSYAYATALLGVSELLRRGGVSQRISRKVVHVGAGMWVFGILSLFSSWQFGIIPFATFILVNALLYRFRLAKGIDATDSTPGTVYFALAITLLFALLWRPQGPIDRVPAAVAGAMALTWGDALAALVGQRYGRHHYTIAGSTRSLEGSATMFVVSALACWLVLTLLPGSALAPFAPAVGAGRALLVALLAAGAGTLAEAVSPRGLDNLSVPLVVALVIRGM